MNSVIKTFVCICYLYLLSIWWSIFKQKKSYLPFSSMQRQMLFLLPYSENGNTWSTQALFRIRISYLWHINRRSFTQGQRVRGLVPRSHQWCESRDAILRTFRTGYKRCRDCCEPVTQSIPSKGHDKEVHCLWIDWSGVSHSRNGDTGLSRQIGVLIHLSSTGHAVPESACQWFSCDSGDPGQDL